MNKAVGMDGGQLGGYCKIYEKNDEGLNYQGGSRMGKRDIFEN